MMVNVIKGWALLIAVLVPAALFAQEPPATEEAPAEAEAEAAICFARTRKVDANFVVDLDVVIVSAAIRNPDASEAADCNQAMAFAMEFLAVAFSKCNTG